MTVPATPQRPENVASPVFDDSFSTNCMKRNLYNNVLQNEFPNK